MLQTDTQERRRQTGADVRHVERHKDPSRVGNTDSETDTQTVRQTDGQTGGSSRNQGQHLCRLPLPISRHGSEQGTLLSDSSLVSAPLVAICCFCFLVFSLFPPSPFFFCFYLSSCAPPHPPPLGFLLSFCASNVCRPSRGAVPTLV